MPNITRGDTVKVKSPSAGLSDGTGAPCPTSYAGTAVPAPGGAEASDCVWLQVSHVDDSPADPDKYSAPLVFHVDRVLEINGEPVARAETKDACSITNSMASSPGQS